MPRNTLLVSGLFLLTLGLQQVLLFTRELRQGQTMSLLSVLMSCFGLQEFPQAPCHLDEYQLVDCLPVKCSYMPVQMGDISGQRLKVNGDASYQPGHSTDMSSK